MEPYFLKLAEFWKQIAEGSSTNATVHSVTQCREN